MSNATSARARLTLSRALSQARLLGAWKTVRVGLRRQDLPDLYDHLDTHWRLPALASRLYAEATAFRYRPREPEIARLEKAWGITRRTAVPAASDAIIMQALVDSIAPSILQAQPTRTAFYARSHQVRSMEELDGTFPSDWLELWKEGQRRIWEFSQTYPVVVVTDVANYFDAIPLSQLRNRIASLGHFEGPVLDLLFYCLEGLTWRPEYLPRSGVGLPQIQFDAPRLLAHAYLYEADRYLRRACRGDVVRWMDDITFGAPDEATAKRILRDLDEILASLGVRLNSGKTRILPARDGIRYFRMAENRDLSVVENILHLRPSNQPTQQRTLAYLKRLFRRFWRGDRFGYWEKIMKRFYTVFGRLRDAYLQRLTPAILDSSPSLRSSIFRYYRALGYSRARFRHIHNFLIGPHCIDDAAVFGAAQLLAEWRVPERGPSRRDVVSLAQALPITGTRTAARFCAALWLLVKYGDDSAVGDMVRNHTSLWKGSEWASRQVAAATVRMTSADAGYVTASMAAFGLLEGAAVLTHLAELRAETQLTSAERRYWQHRSEPYPLAKLVSCLSVIRAGSLSPADATAFRATIRGVVADPVYLQLIGP